MTDRDNPYFATQLRQPNLGLPAWRGIIEPIDDIRAGNPPTNPELLDHLTRQLRRIKFDVRHVLREDLQQPDLPVRVSKPIQLERGRLTQLLPRHARRLPAEVLLRQRSML